MKIEVSDAIKQHYGQYYNNDSEAKGRELGAIDKVDNIVSTCNDFPHDKILEIGAGEGSILQGLSNKKFGEELYAIEISKSGVDAIKRRNIEDVVDVQLFDGYTVPYADNTFDLAILSHVVEHVEHPRLIIREAGRVARYVFIEVPLEDTVLSSDDFKQNRTGHINHFTYKSIRKLVQSSGFDCLYQGMSNTSFALHKYIGSNMPKVILKYLIRKYLLRLFPRIASYFLVYHSYLLLTPHSMSDDA